MTHIEFLQPEHLPQLQALVNAHLSALAPGWALPESFIASRLERNPGEYVVDPWVVARATLCAIERQRVVAVAHLLRYGDGPEVNAPCRNIGELAWLLAWPQSTDAAGALLAAAREHFDRWDVAAVQATELSLPVGPFAGLPDAWPHIKAALETAGYGPNPDIARDECVYAGYLEQIARPEIAPLANLALRRQTGQFGTRFIALSGEHEVGYCECVSDLTDGGALPALRGWAELAEIEVRPSWRDRGVGTWLLQHAAEWLRFGRCDRVLLSVAAEDEAAGAGRFYEHHGLRPLVRLQRGWVLTHFR